MNLRALALTVCCIASGPVEASAGLTSVGVDPGQPNNQPAEPTLAQVAPTQNAGGNAQNRAPGTAVAPITGVPGSAQQAGAGAASAAGTGPGGAAGSPAAAPPRVVVPPPPPDPATLPVSVIKPLNRTPASSPAPKEAGDTNPPESAAPTANEPRAGATAPRPRVAAAVTPAAPLSPRANAPSAPPRAEDAARPASEAEIPADASSSSFIFYSGMGLAAAIVLLSLAAFFRGGSEQAGKPRSL